MEKMRPKNLCIREMKSSMATQQTPQLIGSVYALINAKVPNIPPVSERFAFLLPIDVNQWPKDVTWSC